MSKIRLHGSSSGYTEIAPVAASGNNTLTLPNDGTIISKDSNGAVGVTSVVTTTATITTAKVGAAVTISESGIEASGIGITVANINGTQIGGRKNLIINGDMRVAQRNTSSNSTGFVSVDRMSQQHSGTDEAPSYAQVDVSSGTTPYTLGFRKAFKITNGNQTSGAGSSDYVYWWTILEAQDVSNSGWNYTSASSFITLSFWIKSSVAQNFYGFLQTGDGTSQSLAYETGSLTADTWTKIVKTIPGNSNLEFGNDNGAGLYWAPARAFDGTDRTASMSLDTWATYSGSSRTPDATSTWYTTNDATLEITGLQMEVGSQATVFEHRSIAEELLLCQRYCQVFEGPNNSQGGDSSQTALCENCTLYGANNLFMSIPTKVSMRAKPSMSVATGTNYYAVYTNGAGYDLTGSNLNMNGNTGTEFFVLNHTTNTVGTSGHSALFRLNNTNAKVTFDAEL